MRHLLNSYVQADTASALGTLGDLSLVELIVDSGIHDAIARKLNASGKLTKNSVAEGIVNNIRKTIIRDQLTDPRFYEKMSLLLDDLIQQSRVDSAAYEEFLKKAEALAKELSAKGMVGDVPSALHGRPEATVIWRNLPALLAESPSGELTVADQGPPHESALITLALEIDLTMRTRAPAAFLGDQAREAQVLNELFKTMKGNRTATQALFDLIKNMRGYA